MNNIFTAEGSNAMISRINQLTAETQPQWGKMSVGQMLAHLGVMYEYVYQPEKHPAPGAFFRFIAKAFIKKLVVGPKPYAKNTRTAPSMLMTTKKDFLQEKAKLTGFIERAQQEGAAAFEGRTSPSFGALTAAEWNVLFSKHLDHHLTQFGV